MSQYIELYNQNDNLPPAVALHWLSHCTPTASADVIYDAVEALAAVSQDGVGGLQTR